MDYRSALIAQGVDAVTVDKFMAWHRNNPKVWEEFERLTLKAIKAGKKFGAKAIGEILRWQSEIGRNEEFKGNNNFWSYYSKIFAIKYPLHKDYFEFRIVKGLKEAA